MIIPVAIVLFIIAFYYTIWRPFSYYLFYKRQKNTIAEFIPILSTFPNSKNYVDNHHDYYWGILEAKRKNPNLKVYGRNIGSTYMLYILDPVLTQQLFTTSDTQIQKHQFQNAFIKTLSPFGLVLSQGKVWKKHRKLFGKAFSFQKVQASLQNIIIDVQEKIRTLKSGQIIDTMSFFKLVAGGILSKTFFGIDVNQLEIDNQPFSIFLSQLISELSCQSYSYTFSLFGYSSVQSSLFPNFNYLTQKIKKARAAIRCLVRDQREKRDRGQIPENKKNMWDAFFQHEQTFSEDEIVDEFITFFSDGVYTSGHFMMMTCYYLSQNPQWQEKIRSEVTSLDQYKKQQSLQKLDIIRACIWETLRLAPPVVTGIQRIVLQDMFLAKEYPLKKNTMVMACQVVNHFDPEYHDQPMKYNPERWLDNQSKTNRFVKQYPGLFMPFSIGIRNCPGQHFAKAEGTIFLSSLIKNFNISLDDPKYVMKFTQKFLREPQTSFKIVLKSAEK